MVESSQALVATSLAGPVCTVAIKAPATGLDAPVTRLSAAVSADDQESQNRQHTDRDEERRRAGLVHLVVFGKDASSPLCSSSSSATLAVKLFQFDIELRQSA
jgi:hypothetical protein